MNSPSSDSVSTAVVKMVSEAVCEEVIDTESAFD
ncbi:MAG: hypothetical protein ACI9JR_000955, partial [Gammaproteobacteria bacterium]